LTCKNKDETKHHIDTTSPTNNTNTYKQVKTNTIKQLYKATKGNNSSIAKENKQIKCALLCQPTTTKLHMKYMLQILELFRKNDKNTERKTQH
jgi:hypothetical protein